MQHEVKLTESIDVIAVINPNIELSCVAENKWFFQLVLYSSLSRCVLHQTNTMINVHICMQVGHSQPNWSDHKLWTTTVVMLDWAAQNRSYRKISNIRRTNSQNLNVSRLGLQLSSHNILKPVGAAPTTSEWSTISLPTQVHLILETWW